MHELGIAAQVVEVLTERCGGARIKHVVLEVGVLSAVLPDALRFCFDIVTSGTLAEGATLEVIEVMGRARCNACEREVELTRPFGRCACGESDLTWLSGDELRVRDMEVV